MSLSFNSHQFTQLQYSEFNFLLILVAETNKNYASQMIMAIPNEEEMSIIQGFGERNLFKIRFIA